MGRPRGFKMSAESRAKTSASLLGRPKSEEHRKKIARSVRIQRANRVIEAYGTGDVSEEQVSRAFVVWMEEGLLDKETVGVLFKAFADELGTDVAPLVAGSLRDGTMAALGGSQSDSLDRA